MTHRIVRPAALLVLAAALTALAAACGPAATSQSAASGFGLPAVDGRTFLSTKLEGRALALGTRVTLRFDGAQLGFSAGCNAMGGTVSFVGGRLRLGEVATTDMACDPARMAQDQWLAGFLDGAIPALEADVLTLTDGAVRLTLQDRETADPDRPLEGTHWVVDGLISGAAVSSVPAGVTASLDFAGGTVTVAAGCNRGSAPYSVTAGVIAFGPLTLTKMACDAGPAAVESVVVATLGGTATFAIEAGSLTLRSGASGLTLRAMSPP